MSIWAVGPMPKPGKCITMMTPARYCMMHPFALDGKENNRGYTSSCFTPVYDVPLLDEVIEEASLRKLANVMRERMTIYPVGAALAAHLEELEPEHAVHALPGRFEMQFASPLKLQEDIAVVPWRLPP